VEAGIVNSPGDYLWSSARHYLEQHIDPLIQQSPLCAMVDDWQTFLTGDVDAESRAAIGRAERSGRPLGDADFVFKLEEMFGRELRRKKPGPKAGGY
jgi:putative transposase